VSNTFVDPHGHRGVPRPNRLHSNGFECRARELNPNLGCPRAVFKTAASAISPARPSDSMGQRSALRYAVLRAARAVRVRGLQEG
jgi:hypothetical protein